MFDFYVTVNQRLGEEQMADIKSQLDNIKAAIEAEKVEVAAAVSELATKIEELKSAIEAGAAEDEQIVVALDEIKTGVEGIFTQPAE